ncbi:helix-turn-helix transcriptional regulator [Salmonella enterica]|nr:helix-turn-helix transcriptional regulator [Salmonella enterica]
MALLTAIDRSYVGRIERGEVNITLESCINFLRYLSVMFVIFCLSSDLV